MSPQCIFSPRVGFCKSVDRAARGLSNAPSLLTHTAACRSANLCRRRRQTTGDDARRRENKQKQLASERVRRRPSSAETNALTTAGSSGKPEIFTRGHAKVDD